MNPTKEINALPGLYFIREHVTPLTWCTKYLHVDELRTAGRTLTIGNASSYSDDDCVLEFNRPKP